MLSNKTVRLNIGGTIFKCRVDTLHAFPGSKLANLDKQTDAFDNELREYYFDRNPILFAFILDSFRKGEVHIPKDICGSTFRKELEFWEISPRNVAACCLEALYQSEEDIATINLLLRRFHRTPNQSLMQQEHPRFRSRLWLFLDEPRSSKLAMVWNLFISCVIVATTASDCLGTMETFQENLTEPHVTYFTKFAEKSQLDNATLVKLLTMKPLRSLLLTKIVCNSILTLELVVSFVVCENKRCFITCLIRIMAGLGYLSYWISIIVYENFSHFESIYAVMVYSVFGFLSIFRLARLIYITKNVPAFQIIYITFKSSKKELTILFFLLGIFVCVFGFFFYSVEVFHNSKINNVFPAIYWALITVTTVGYGDYVPKTVAGHVIGSACAVCGVLVLALPVGIIVSKFYRYYDYHGFTTKHAKI